MFVLLSLSLLQWGGPGLGFPSPCQALTPLTELRILPDVKVDQKQVSLLDLCDRRDVPEDWKTVLAQDSIGPAPTAGSEKIIHPDQLLNHIHRFLNSRGYDPSNCRISIPEKIIVRRQSIQVSKAQIEEIYRDFILSKSPWSQQDVVIHDVFFSGSLELPAGEMSHEVVANPRERFVGNVSVAINFLIDGEKERSVRVSGKVDLYQNVLQASRPLKRNDVIAESDIEVGRVNVGDAPDRFSTQSELVVGKRLLRSVGVHQPINSADLDNPLALKRGNGVTIVYNQPGLKLTARGEVREDATIGGKVRVINVTTNRTIFCRVLDAETVLAIP